MEDSTMFNNSEKGGYFAFRDMVWQFAVWIWGLILLW